MLTRLLGMGVGEVAGRSRQHASKWLDRTVTRLPRPVLVGETGNPANPEPEAQRALDRFRSSGPDRFFAGATDVPVSRLLESIAPGDVQATLASAESI